MSVCPVSYSRSSTLRRSLAATLSLACWMPEEKASTLLLPKGATEVDLGTRLSNDAAVFRLCDELAVNTKCKRLRWEKIKLSNEGAERLAAALSQNYTVISIGPLPLHIPQRQATPSSRDASLGAIATAIINNSNGNLALARQSIFASKKLPLNSYRAEGTWPGERHTPPPKPAAKPAA